MKTCLTAEGFEWDFLPWEYNFRSCADHVTLTRPCSRTRREWGKEVVAELSAGSQTCVVMLHSRERKHPIVLATDVSSPCWTRGSGDRCCDYREEEGALHGVAH